MRFRSGKLVSIDLFNWYTNFPTGGRGNILFRIRRDNRDPQEGLLNMAAFAGENGVVCEL